VLFKVAELRLVHALFLLVMITNLNCAVAVLLFGFDLQRDIAADLDDRHRGNPAVIIIDPRHAYFATEQSDLHGRPVLND
jgi:hypothetical protein